MFLLQAQNPRQFSSVEIQAPGCKGELLVGKSIFLAANDPTVRKSNLACFRSDDAGLHWRKLGSITTDPVPAADLGDGNLIRSGNTLFAVYRRNHTRGEYAVSPEYGVHVSTSSDGGLTWQFHSMVVQHRINRVGPSRGYWAPFLFKTKGGLIQCYYDDEYTPYQQGFRGHQWIEMKTLDPKTRRWTSEVTVSRAPNPKELSRDGMATVIESQPNRLLCLLESVSTTSPVVGNIRSVTSDDGGKSWSWSRGRRPVVYQAKSPFHSFSPWLVAGRNGVDYCLFATDEDNRDPHPAGTPAVQLRLDIKMLVSQDLGNTWGSKTTVYAGSHHNYLPSGLTLKSGVLFVSWLDFDRGDLSALVNTRGR